MSSMVIYVIIDVEARKISMLKQARKLLVNMRKLQQRFSNTDCNQLIEIKTELNGTLM